MFNLLVVLNVIPSLYILNNIKYVPPIKKMSVYAKVIGIFLFCAFLILIVNQYIISTPILNKEVGEIMLYLTILLANSLLAICAYRNKVTQKV